MAATAPRLLVLAVSTLMVGVTSVVVMVLVPFAADLAADHERGRVVGTVMSGLLIGILASRTLAGLVATGGGWRMVYAGAAAVMMVLAVVLSRALPAVPFRMVVSDGAGRAARYRLLLASLAVIVRQEPVLRRRSLYGALCFAAFSAVWTTVGYLLAGSPYRYDPAQIGLLGLAGAAGAAIAGPIGRLADRGHQRTGTGLCLVLLVLSFAATVEGTHHLFWLIVGAVVLDLAVQGAHILNQSQIYQLQPDARSRITTVYMTSYFLGGTAGSALSSWAYSHCGWPGVSVLGAAFGLTALIAWATEKRPRASLNRGQINEASIAS